MATAPIVLQKTSYDLVAYLDEKQDFANSKLLFLMKEAKMILKSGFD
jgi:hypothetical protein